MIAISEERFMLKKRVLLLVFLMIVSMFLMGCRTTDVQAGTYELKTAEETVRPFIRLYEKEEFLFVYSFLSSYLSIGTYEVQNGKLILETSDGEYTYRFRIRRNSLVFLADESSELKLTDKVEDGAVFELIPEL